MNDIITDISDFNQIIKRNIINVINTIEPFDDLINGKKSNIHLANSIIFLTKKRINTIDELNDFYYTTAITYPFVKEPIMMSRYSDGTFPIWYGSLDQETTIEETKHHMLSELQAIEGIQNLTSIKKRRVIYDIKCHALLIDLSKKRDSHPDLISNDYSFCHSIAKRIQSEGHAGILSPSARCVGTNINVFKQSVLSDPKPVIFLTYEYDHKNTKIDVVINTTSSKH